MDRRDFLHNQVRVLVACALCSWQACRKDMQAGDEKKEIIIDLEKALLIPGSWLRLKEVLVIRIRPGFTADCFEAVQSFCPHAGGQLEWNVQEQQVICPVHGSRFSSSGGLLAGPAATSLKRFSVVVKEGRYLVVS